MKKEYIIPIFVPHLGCPNDCTFCNQKKISGQSKMVTAKDVENTIEYYLKNFKDHNRYVEVAFFGGSFTGIEIEKQVELLNAAYKFILNKKVNSIRLSTRPDYINKEELVLLKKYGVKTIELGVQSTNNDVLNSCKRGHTFEQVKKASKLIKKYGFILGHQMMVGLPNSTRIDEINTAKDLIKLKPEIVRIYPVLVINGTQLEQQYNEGTYIPLTVEQAVEIAKVLLLLFNKKHINVIRIGLQNTNEITNPYDKDSEVIAGPFHPAFRQLVESSIWMDRLTDVIKGFNASVKKATIRVSSLDVNNVVGHKRKNITRIKDIYGVDLKIKNDKKIKKNKMIVSLIEK